jgi:cobalt/nickel transport system permease protein
VLAGRAAIAILGCALGLRRTAPEDIPRVAVLSAVTFVAALVHFPVGPSSVHLLLTGLAGIVLGWAAFPAIVVALTLQAVLFGFGGIVVLGVNVATMAVPAVLCGGLFHLLRTRLAARPALLGPAAGLCAALGVLLTALAVALALAASGREFLPAARLVVLAHLPVMGIEAAFTAAAISLVARVRPDLLAAPCPRVEGAR